jgi:hypothetical protein
VRTASEQVRAERIGCFCKSPRIMKDDKQYLRAPNFADISSPWKAQNGFGRVSGGYVGCSRESNPMRLRFDPCLALVRTAKPASI